MIKFGYTGTRESQRLVCKKLLELRKLAVSRKKHSLRNWEVNSKLFLAMSELLLAISELLLAISELLLAISELPLALQNVWNFETENFF